MISPARGVCGATQLNSFSVASGGQYYLVDVNPALTYQGPRMARVTPSIPGFDPERAALIPTERTSAEKRALRRRDDYRRAQSLMNLWISRPELGLDLVAGELGMTPRQLQRVFHSQRSEGFRAELLEMRMTLAAQLLEGQRPISEIARSVGYRGPMHFAKASPLGLLAPSVPQVSSSDPGREANLRHHRFGRLRPARHLSFPA